MTHEEALEDYVRRACESNLYITITGGTLGRPRFIAVVTYGNSFEELIPLRDVLGGNTINSQRGACAKKLNIHKQQAVELLEELIPLLEASENMQAKRRARYGRDKLKAWKQGGWH